MDNDYTNAIKVNTPIQQYVNINELISINSLTSGIHNFNIRFKDNANIWSSVICHFLYKTDEPELYANNKIIGYRYWIGNYFNQAKYVSLTSPTLILNL